MVEAIQDMTKALRKLNNSFNRAMDAIQECEAQNASCRMAQIASRRMVDPIPLRKRSAIIQLQGEDLEDHQIVEITKLFQADVSIADTYLAIEEWSLRKLFLLSYL